MRNIQDFFLEMVAPGGFGAPTASKGPTSPQELFSRFLEKATGKGMQGAWQGPKGGLPSRPGSARNHLAGQDRTRLLAACPRSEYHSLGKQFVSKYRTKGLEQFLANEGFSEGSIKDFLSALFEEKGKEKVSVPELLVSLLNFEKASGKPVFDAEKGASLLPRLKELLGCLDLGNQGAIDQADPALAGTMEPGEIASSFQLGRWISERIGEDVSGKTGPERETGWVQALRNRLLAGGKPLQELALSPEGLPVLKAVLSGHGISEEDIDTVFPRGGVGGSDEAIGISEVLNRIMNLVDQDRADDDNLLLTPAVVPQLESLLRAFGLNAAQTREVIVQSKVEGGALGVRRLQNSLRGIAFRISREGQSVVGEGNADLSMVLAKIGMSEEMEPMAKGPVSLKGFIKILDEKIARSGPARLSRETVEAQTKRLLDHVVSVEKEQDINPGRAVRDHHPRAFNGLGKKGMGQLERVSFLQGEGVSRSENGPTGETKPTTGDQRGQGFPLAQTEDGAQPLKDLGAFKMPSLSAGREPGGAERHSEKVPLELTDPASRIGGRPASPAATVKPNAPSIPLHVVNQVGKRITHALKRGDHHLRIRLKPPELGSIQLEMTLKDSALKIAMVAEHHAVKEALMSHVSDLRQALMHQGIDLQKVDVEIDYNFGQSMANARKNLGGDRSMGRRSPSGAGAADLEQGVEDIQPTQAARMAAYSRLDVFA